MNYPNGLLNLFLNPFLSIYAFSITVGRCPPVPRIQHASADSTNASDGSIVTLICDVGYTFDNGLTTEIRCENTEWQHGNLDVYGEHLTNMANT